MAAYYKELLASRYDEETDGPAAKERRSLLKQINALNACIKDSLEALGFRAVRGTKYAWRR
jgi:hypothetical protein